jgi:hypothetical protein
MSDWLTLDLIKASDDLKLCEQQVLRTRIVAREAMKRLRIARNHYQRLLDARELVKGKERAS